LKKIILFTLILFSTTFFGQQGTLDLTFNPTDLGSGNLANGPVKITSTQSDGKIIIGGGFTTYNGNAINRIARLNTDGSLDITFNVGIGPNYDVNAISIQSDGKIIIGGSFTLFNGFPKVGVVRLNTDGTLDTTFNNNNLVGPADPTTVNTNKVLSTSIQSDGKIIIGGILRFQLNSSFYYKIARLNTNGSLDTSFTITLQGHPVYTTSIQSDGKIIIGGGSNSTSYLISRLNTDGTIDNTFNVGTGPNNVVTTTSIQADGKIIIGGNFTSFNGVSRNRIARLNTNGTLDSSFVTGNITNINVLTTCIQNDGKIIIGGVNNSSGIARLNTDGTDDTTFNVAISPGIYNINSVAIQNDGKIIIGQGSGDGVPVKNVFRLNTNGTVDSQFDFISGGTNGNVSTSSIQSDGKIIIGGSFTSCNGITRNRMARLNTNGSLDTSFNIGTGANEYIRTTSIQNDGKIIIGGDFTSYNGVARNGIARLNTDGSLDTTFNPGTGANNEVHTTFIQSDGKIIIAGSFTSFNSISRNKITRLNADGTLDTSFSSGTGTNNNGVIYSTSIQSDGKIIIGGSFFSYNGTNRFRVARLNANGSLDGTFNPPTYPQSSIETSNNFVQRVSIQNDGKIIIVGRFYATFATLNNISRNGIARLNTDGTLDTTFDPGTGTGNTTALVHPFTSSIQSDGKIIIGGSFTSFNGIATNQFARLNTNGTLDTTFNIGTGFNGLVRTISIQNDGKIIIGGDFTSYNGTGKNRIARINSGAALSNPSFDLSTTIIYPNPSNGYFNIKIDNLIGTENIEVYSVLGQKIYSKSIVENKSTIDVSNQPKGIYFYKISNNNNVIKSGKLILE
jgi:uncharacterized delta-60 repeat protein